MGLGRYLYNRKVKKNMRKLRAARKEAEEKEEAEESEEVAKWEKAKKKLEGDKYAEIVKDDMELYSANKKVSLAETQLRLKEINRRMDDLSERNQEEADDEEANDAETQKILLFKELVVGIVQSLRANNPQNPQPQPQPTQRLPIYQTTGEAPTQEPRRLHPSEIAHSGGNNGGTNPVQPLKTPNHFSPQPPNIKDMAQVMELIRGFFTEKQLIQLNGILTEKQKALLRAYGIDVEQL